MIDKGTVYELCCMYETTSKFYLIPELRLSVNIPCLIDTSENITLAQLQHLLNLNFSSCNKAWYYL